MKDPKQLKIGETEEEYNERMKHAKQDALKKMKLREDDIIQFVDSKGMEKYLVDITTGFMEEREDKEKGGMFPPCFLVAIGQINPEQIEQEYVRRWIKIRDLETLLKVRRTTEIGYWTGAIFFGYYEALKREKQTKGVITFEDKFRSYMRVFINHMRKRLTQDNLIEISKEVRLKFISYMNKTRKGESTPVHNNSKLPTALKIYREEMEKRMLWR